MPNLASIVASINAARRRRMPRIVRAYVVDGSLVVQFDRPMDRLFDVCTIRTVDSTSGVVDWGSGKPGWSDDGFVYSTDNRNVVDPSFAGVSATIYLSGNMRSRGRYRVPSGQRGPFIDINEVPLSIDGGDPEGVFSGSIDGGDPEGVFSGSIDGGVP